jgi:hypothetical protein
MVTKTRFNRAAGLIPSNENIKDRNFTIYEGDLYFTGDTSWFKVENFIECDCNISLSHKALSLATGLGGTVKAKSISDYAVRFTNGRLNMDVSCSKVTECPEPPILSKEKYTDLSDIFPAAKGIFGLMDKISMVCAATVNDRKCVVCASNRLLAVVSEPGGHNDDIDLTRIESVITSAINSNAKANIGPKRANFFIEEKDYKIYSACSSMPASLSNNARTLIETINSGGLEDNNEDDITVIEIEGSELLKIIPTAEKIKDSGLTMYYADEDVLRVRIEDMMGIVFEGTLRASTVGNLQFESRLVDKQMLDFLGATSGKKGESRYRLVANKDERKMIVRSASNPEGVEAFVVMGLSFKSWSTSQDQ